MFRPAVLRAINISLIAAFVIVAGVASLAICETLYVLPGEGYLNSDLTVTQTNDEKLRDILRGVMILPFEVAGLALVFFVAQLPFILGES